MNPKARSAELQPCANSDGSGRAEVLRSCAIVAVAFAATCASAAIPRSPADELKSFQLADTNLVVELVAAEPAIRAPVAIAWDADARLYVAEMTDYPSGPISGRIRLLEDRDGDGRYEHSQIFATNLAFPNGMMPWKNGILVTAAPDIWFLADTNGDGVADARERVLTGFAEGNQQLRVNGLFWGIDNWIYGANGRSDGEIKWADGTPAGSIRRHDFRFRPDTKQFEAIAGNSQFGMGHDDWGNRFPVFNNMPIRHVVIEEKYLASLAGIDLTPNISPTNDGNRVFAITSPNLLIPQPIGFFTSACGPSIFRGTGLPENYRGNYFVCEPVQNIVQRRVLKPSGSTFHAEYAHTNAEFLASSDPWFHGVFTATGPDGAFHIVDMYRDLVEHPHWVAPELRDKVDWRKGEEHGRIWRIRAKDAKLDRAPKLSRASNAELSAHLENRNGWIRDTAQRLLAERRATNQVPALKQLARAARAAETRVCSLNLLAEFTPTNLDLLVDALADSHPRVRETALRLIETIRPDGLPIGSALLQEQFRTNLLARCDDPDARVRLQAACYWSLVPGDAARTKFARIALNRELDAWQSMLIVAGVRAQKFQAALQAYLLLHDQLGPLLDSGAEEQLTLLERLAGVIGAKGDDRETTDFVNWLRDLRSRNRLLLLAGFVEAAPPKERGEFASIISTNELLDIARGQEPARLRIAAIRIAAARADAANVLKSFVPLLQHETPESIQGPLVRFCLDLFDPDLTRAVLDHWSECSKAVRRQIIALSARQPRSAEPLIDALERRTVPLVEVDASSRSALQKSGVAEVRQRAMKLFASAASDDRQAVVAKYRPALTMTADRTRGAALFEKNCTVCHQMQGVGAKVGPDLSGVGQQPRETLLVQILDPSSAVLPDYVAYTATTKDDESYTGFLVNESADSITLRRANEPDITLRRADLKELATSGKSLMPDGLEAAITIQDMADLLEFLRRPDRTLFTQSK